MESESDEEEIGVVESDCSNDEAVWLLTNMQATSSHFQGFTPSELEVLVTKMLVLCLKGGEPLMSQGEESTFYALMLSGEAKIVVQGEDKSTPPVTVASLKAGEIIGEMALFDGGVRSATVTCIEEENVVAIMHFDNLKALISSHPELGMKLVKQALSISVQRLTTKNVVDEDFDLTHGSPDQIQAMIRHFEKTTLVEELDSKQLKLLSTHLSVCSFEKGDPIIKKGNKSRYLLILVKGEAAVYAESQLLATINKTGSFLGESIMYTAVRKANVVAHTNCTFCVLPLWNLESLSMEDPQLVLSIITILGRDILSQLRSTHGIKEPEEPKPAPVDKKSGKKKAPRESKGQKKMEGVLASRKPGKPGGEGDKEKEKKPKELTAAQYKTKMLSERAMREAAEKNLQALQVQFKALGGIMPGEGTPDGEKEGARRSANEPFDGEVELMEMLEQKTLIAQALHKSVAEKEERIATLEAENEVAALGLTKLEEVVESLRKENQALSDELHDKPIVKFHPNAMLSMNPIGDDVKKPVAGIRKSVAQIQGIEQVAAPHTGDRRASRRGSMSKADLFSYNQVLEGAGGQMEMAQQKAIAHQRDRWTALEQDFLESVIQAEWDLVQFMVELTTGIEVDLNDWEKKLRISSKKGWISALEEVMQMVESAFDDLCLQYTTLVEDNMDLKAKVAAGGAGGGAESGAGPGAAASLAGVTKELDGLRNAMRYSKRKMDTMQMELSTKARQLEEEKASGAEVMSGLVELEKVVKERNEQIDAQQADMERLSSQLAAVRAEAEDLRQKNTDLGEELRQMQIHDINTTWAIWASRLIHRRSGWENLNNMSSVVTQLKQAKEEEEKQNRLLSDAQRRLNELEGSKGAKLNKDMKARVDDLTAQLEKETKISVDLSEKLIQKDDERLIQEKLVAVKDQELKVSEGERHKLLEEVNRMQISLKKVWQRIRTVQGETLNMGRLSYWLLIRLLDLENNFGSLLSPFTAAEQKLIKQLWRILKIKHAPPKLKFNHRRKNLCWRRWPPFVILVPGHSAAEAGTLRTSVRLAAPGKPPMVLAHSASHPPPCTSWLRRFLNLAVQMQARAALCLRRELALGFPGKRSRGNPLFIAECVGGGRWERQLDLEPEVAAPEDPHGLSQTDLLRTLEDDFHYASKVVEGLEIKPDAFDYKNPRFKKSELRTGSDLRRTPGRLTQLEMMNKSLDASAIDRLDRIGSPSPAEDRSVSPQTPARAAARTAPYGSPATSPQSPATGQNRTPTTKSPAPARQAITFSEAPTLASLQREQSSPAVLSGLVSSQSCGSLGNEGWFERSPSSSKLPMVRSAHFQESERPRSSPSVMQHKAVGRFRSGGGGNFMRAAERRSIPQREAEHGRREKPGSKIGQVVTWRTQNIHD
ncbi:hypothetical protein CYMTET_3386 [Cymbomonas tetramitiformis]|uniref:Cyclic nucleotide-binding domain-containing protein n=1 Tax=Cymbomonas tetramitiformis TaxID=36881 RepID=A0AAE0H3G3_9CHLO|nr:hypothetical protein CYMTET_3386 [Cymbomonas tetramitiformis]